jgi:hypothetical protein
MKKWKKDSNLDEAFAEMAKKQKKEYLLRSR